MLYIKSVDKKNPIGKAVQDYANNHFKMGFIYGFVLGFSIGVSAIIFVKKN